MRRQPSTVPVSSGALGSMCCTCIPVCVFQLSFSSNHCMAVWFTSLGDITKFANDVIPFEFQGINNWVNCITSSCYNPLLRIYPHTI